MIDHKLKGPVSSLDRRHTLSSEKLRESAN
jgi:hypothetical protein